MSNKVTLIGKTVSLYNNDNEDLNVLDEAKIFAGRAAGICYMPDDYLSEGITNTDKAIKRAGMNAKNGHFSVYDHFNISFIIETTKAMAMLLNSTNLYATSEKSGRYTKMKGETEFERDMYGKWMGTFSTLIRAYNRKMEDKAVEKLAMENARYMLSVFVPTTMQFTVPMSRAILLCEWLDKLAANIVYLHKESSYDFGNLYTSYYYRLAEECIDLANCLRSELGIDKSAPLLEDKKNQNIPLLKNINDRAEIKARTGKDISTVIKGVSVYTDIYSETYYASFVALADLERHRTIHYAITEILDDCYVPAIIKNTKYEQEWKDDFNLLLKNNIVPQCTLLEVLETGRFEDFYMKCKDRLCIRAQYEPMSIIRDMAEKFYLYRTNLAPLNANTIESMVDVDKNVKTRCQFCDFICPEHCGDRFVNKGNYLRNV